MKKRLIQLACALFALAPAGLHAAEEGAVQLQFELSGSDVTVSVVDETGAAMEGVTATLSSASHSFTAPKGSITDNMLSPSVNFNTSPTVNMTFTIEGLPADFQFNNVGLDIHALNSGGNYQENNDGQKRQFNFSISCGNATDALTTFATLSDIDIAAGIGEQGAVHQVWDFVSSTTKTATDPLVLSITATKGTTNNGCFMALTSITLSQKEGVEPDPEEPEEDVFPNPDSYYYLKGNGTATLYMTETSDGKITTSAPQHQRVPVLAIRPDGKRKLLLHQECHDGALHPKLQHGRLYAHCHGDYAGRVLHRPERHEVSLHLHGLRQL